MKTSNPLAATLLVAVFATSVHAGDGTANCRVPAIVCESLPPGGCLAPALNGRLAAIDDTLEASINHLDAGDLQKFTDAAHDLVSAFDGASADIHKACRDAGYTLARLQHASLLLSQSNQRDARFEKAVQPASDDVASLRDRLVKRLTEDHRHFQKETDSERKRRLLNSMEATVQRIDQLSSIIQSAEEANRFQLPVSELQQLLDEATATVQAEQEMLVTQSQALSAIVVQAFGCMDTSLQVRSVSHEFPDEQIVKLKETRASLTKLIQLSQNARRAAGQVSENSVAKVPTDSLTDGVLSRVQRVLTTYPQEKAESR